MLQHACITPFPPIPGFRRREREGDREKRGKEKKRRDGEAKHRHGPQNTYALARTTFKITTGCLCRGPSRRFQGACRFSTLKKTTCPTVRLSGPCFKTGRTRPKKKTCTCAGPSQAALEMAASGAHARQASVNEPSGARLFSGFWVEIGQCARDHGEQFELRLELALSQCRFPRLPQVKIEWAQVWRARRPREELDVALLQKRLGAPTGV